MVWGCFFYSEQELEKKCLERDFKIERNYHFRMGLSIIERTLAGELSITKTELRVLAKKMYDFVHNDLRNFLIYIKRQEGDRGLIDGFLRFMRKNPNIEHDMECFSTVPMAEFKRWAPLRAKIDQYLITAEPKPAGCTK